MDTLKANGLCQFYKKVKRNCVYLQIRMVLSVLEVTRRDTFFIKAILTHINQKINSYLITVPP